MSWRKLLVTVCLTLALGPALARESRPTTPVVPVAVTTPTTLVEGGYYTNHDGQSIHRPAHTPSNQAPAGASAQCRDGSFSFSASRRGTCSRHGGVSTWL
jgi:hypothetical protein